jgi:NadR type nicotinamide-nucleotide adenylyltransferase
MKIGLTLGKFAPLHKGHQFVIETALREVDHLIVIIYNCPEVIDIPLSTRAGWIRTLYPKVEVIESLDGPLIVGDTKEIREMHETYLLGAVGNRGITHFYSSEFYGDHVSRAFCAIDRRIDPDRAAVPISATMIRSDPFRYREFLDPVVYRSLVTNVLFLGAPSSGKTTLAKACAETFNTVWMPEYGREYWDDHQVNRRLSLEQLVEIAEGHLIREDALLLDANRYLFTDTNALTTYMFSKYYHGTVHPKLAVLADSAWPRYDIVILCGIDIPYDDTEDRSGDPMRQVFQQDMIKELLLRSITYHTVEGSLSSRIARVQKLLQRVTSNRR